MQPAVLLKSTEGGHDIWVSASETQITDLSENHCETKQLCFVHFRIATVRELSPVGRGRKLAHVERLVPTRQRAQPLLRAGQLGARHLFCRAPRHRALAACARTSSRHPARFLPVGAGRPPPPSLPSRAACFKTYN
eukprot:scaffold205227_cov29-Tisochrysis_lutea.AAC.1